MEFAFDEDERILMDSARKLFEKEAPSSRVQGLLNDETGYSQELWIKMAELGWMGLPFHEEYGGYGGSFAQLAILFEAMGRAAVSSPFFSTIVLGGLLLQDVGSVESKRRYLPEISKGKSTFTMAMLGKNGVYSRNELGLECKRYGEDFKIHGPTFYVPFGHLVDKIICAAKASSGDGGGVTLFLVDRDSIGIEAIPLHTIAGKGRECVVRFNDVKAKHDQIVGQVGQGFEHLETLWPKIAVSLSCECVGGMDRVLELTLAHVKERVQFGKPLASLQVVQHMCADMFTKAETARHFAHYAAWLISQGQECRKAAAIAKSWCADAFKEVTRIAHQLSGGIGFCEEYDLHLYTRNAKSMELLFGDGHFYRSIVADTLGL